MPIDNPNINPDLGTPTDIWDGTNPDAPLDVTDTVVNDNNHSNLGVGGSSTVDVTGTVTNGNENANNNNLINNTMKDMLTKVKEFFTKEYKDIPYWLMALVPLAVAVVWLYSETKKKFR